MEATRLRGWVLVGAQLVMLAILIFTPPGDAWRMPRPLRWAGIALRLIGLLAIAVGAVNLGRSLSVHPEPTGAAVLKTDGLYRHVRHPIYTGVLVLGAGIALTSSSLIAVGAMAGLVAVLSVKARFEEELLRRRFPDYEEYASRTPAFIPKPGALFGAGM